MAKTKSLTGHIYRRGNNFSAQFRIKRKVKSFALHTTIRREAEQKTAELAKIVGADTKKSVAAYVAEARIFRKSSSLSIDDAWDAFFASVERPDCGSSTLRKYKCFWIQFVNWVKNNRPALDKIGEVDLETTGEHFSQLSQKKLSGAGFNGHRQALHLVFRILKAQARMDINPIDEIAKKQNLQRSHKELSAEQLKELLGVFDKADLPLMNNEEMRVMFHQGRKRSVNQFGFHSLRHTFVSICANAGVPLAVVQSIIGHDNPSMTRLYTHLAAILDFLRGKANDLKLVSK